MSQAIQIFRIADVQHHLHRVLGSLISNPRSNLASDAVMGAKTKPQGQHCIQRDLLNGLQIYVSLQLSKGSHQIDFATNGGRGHTRMMSAKLPDSFTPPTEDKI